MSLQEGNRRKEVGIDLAASAKAALVVQVREYLKILARSKFSREVTADDAAWFCEREGYGIHALGNAAGAIFREPCWSWTGKWAKSDRDHAHANDIRIWRLKAGF